MSEISTEEVNKKYGNRLRIRATGICIENDKILLIKHIQLGKLGYLWSFPGGGVDFGEDIKTTIKREFLEETGLEVEVKHLLFVHQYLDLPLHSIEFCFLVTKIKGNLMKGIDPEIEKQMIKEVAFLDIEQIKNIPRLAKHFKLREITEVNHLHFEIREISLEN
ncbi:MAG: NUDIX hydrolase [Bacteroidetes bacterium]|nr:MAG: NUDIX hydrolase [Bacteroidota bacterium]TAG88547.1 MAG: NUDIX hydrolase [Bacteroidota bacterium]